MAWAWLGRGRGARGPHLLERLFDAERDVEAINVKCRGHWQLDSLYRSKFFPDTSLKIPCSFSLEIAA
jgi:hypothetical protein